MEEILKEEAKNATKEDLEKVLVLVCNIKAANLTEEMTKMSESAKRLFLCASINLMTDRATPKGETANATA